MAEKISLQSPKKVSLNGNSLFSEWCDYIIDPLKIEASVEVMELNK